MSAIPIANAIPPPHHAAAITSKVLGGQVLPGELSFSTRSHQHVKSKEMNRGALRVCGSASPTPMPRWWFQQVCGIEAAGAPEKPAPLSPSTRFSLLY